MYIEDKIFAIRICAAAVLHRAHTTKWPFFYRQTSRAREKSVLDS